MTVGRLVFPALRWRDAGGFAPEEPIVQQGLELGTGGFILFGGTRDEVRKLTADLRAAAGRPLLIASDLERGAGQQVAGLAELPPPLALASLDDPAVVRGAGALTATQALSVGINWVLAPVADLDLEPENPIVQTRAFGADPARVGPLVAAWVTGCEAAGALACLKHWPGHGRTRHDSHDALPVVDAPREVLLAEDLAPFAAGIAAGVSSVMTAHVAYPALDPGGAAATFSAPILDLLRTGLGFEGLIVSDALMMEGARRGGTPSDAIAAGVDLLLYPDDPAGAARDLDRRAAREPELGRRVEAALARYERALRQVASGPVPEQGESGSATAAADWLLDRPLLRGEAPALTAPVELVVVDDDLHGRWPANPLDGVARGLDALRVPRGPGGSRILLAAATPRGSKGRAGFGAESLAAIAREATTADLLVLFGHPRLVPTLPTSAPVLLAWHRQPLMQTAVARWIRARLP